jgi:MarR family transcriptional regulator, lower aerobic nicotinate degradation pathway regulator
VADRADAPNLTDALVELSFLIHFKLARIASEHEISLTLVRLLGILRDREPGIVELASAMSLDKSSVSGLVDRAQRRGLVERASSKTMDGRAIRVLLTPSGHTLASRFAEQLVEQVDDLLADFAPTERERLARLAARVVAASGIASGLEAPRSAPPASRLREAPSRSGLRSKI